MRNIIKGDEIEKARCVQAHRFPEIQGAPKPANGKGARGEKNFQRLRFCPAETREPQAAALHGGNGRITYTVPDEVATLREKAFKEGLCQGEKAGSEAERKKMEPLLNNLRRALVQLEEARREIHRAAEKQIVELALAVARKVVCREVSVNRDVIVDVVKEALKRVANQELIKIRVGPAALEILKNPACLLAEEMDGYESICIEEDKTISSGGCVIETQLGDIDARIEEQLRVLESAFKEELAKAELRN